MLKKGEFLTSLGFFAAGLYTAVKAMGFSIWADSGLMGLGPQEGFFPLAAGAVMMALSLINMVHIRRMSPAQIDPLGEETEERKGSRPTYFRVFSYLTFMLLFGFLLVKVGFLLSSFLLLFPILKFVEKQSWKRAISTTIGAIFISYFVLVYFLGVPLPRGLIK